MEKSLAFYTAFFDAQPDRFCPGRFVVFTAGNTKLSLYNPKYDEKLVQSGKDLSGHFNDAYLANRERAIAYGNNVVLNIGVDDLAAEYARVKALGIGEMTELMYINIAAPYWCFWLFDPDGNQIEVTGAYEPETVMDDLVGGIKKLAELEIEHPGLVSRPLLQYLKEWLAIVTNRNMLASSLPHLRSALEDGLDVDFTGTQWETEWLADGKICKCKACALARDCIKIIDEIVEEAK
jgi:lactoylglutathione lyase